MKFEIKEIKKDKEKLKAMREVLPWNFANWLYNKYLQLSIKEKQIKPKYSISYIRKVSTGERKNDEILQELINIANQMDPVIRSKNIQKIYQVKKTLNL